MTKYRKKKKEKKIPRTKETHVEKICAIKKGLNKERKSIK